MTGLAAVCVTPFSGGRPDEKRLRRRVSALADAGVGANLCSYGPGEGNQLTLAEAVLVYRWGVEEAAGRVPVTAAGVPGTATAALEHALAAEAAGVDVVQLPQPRREPPLPAASQADVESFWEGLLEKLDVRCQLAVHTQQSPGLAAAPDLLARLAASHRNVGSVVVTGADDRYLLRVLEALAGRAAVVTTSLDTLLLNLELGAGGVQCLELNLVPRLAARLVEHHRRREAKEALAVSAEIARLELAVFGSASFPHTLKLLKAALELLDGTGGELRPPYLPLEDVEVAAVEPAVAMLRRAGA